MKNFTIILFILVSEIFSGHSQRNYKFENFGNISILLNGNVTGSVEDLGATYYNPARLALIEDPVFLINAKMYQLTNIKLDNVTLDGNNLSTSSFNGVPSMIAGTFKLKALEGHQFAYAFFSRNRSDLSIGYRSEIEENAFFNDDLFISKYVNSTKIKNQLRENWYGVSWGKSMSSNFNIGASLFFSTYKFENVFTEELHTINDASEVSNYTNFIHFKQKSYGFFGKIAVAWILPKVELGLNIDLPYLELLSVGEFSYEEYLSSFGNKKDIFTFNDFDELDAKRKYPFGISIGTGIPMKKHKIHLNLSYNGKLDEYEKIKIPELESETEEDLPNVLFSEELKPILNFGFGAEVYISDKLNAYISFSSDYSPFTTISDANISNTYIDVNFDADYFHYGFGVNVSHKWVNFILGTIYSRGSTDKIKLNSLPLSSYGAENQYSKLYLNRWRFVLGLEVLFLENSKLSKFGSDNRLF